MLHRSALPDFLFATPLAQSDVRIAYIERSHHEKFIRFEEGMQVEGTLAPRELSLAAHARGGHQGVATANKPRT